MCRECGKAMETVKHILNMCEPKGFSLYKERHDQAILIVLWRLLKQYKFKQEEPWYKLEAKPVYENRAVTILWDPSIPTDDEMTERKPDLVVEDRLCKSIYITDMSVPTDSNINGRWQEKFQKYQKLAADMRKQFRGYRIKVVPMIIGALGTVDTLLEDLRGIPKLSKRGVEVMRAMQRTVLCSAVRILRRHLSVEGLGPGREVVLSQSLPVDLWKAGVDWCMEVLPPIMTVNFGPTHICLLLPEGGKAEASG